MSIGFIRVCDLETTGFTPPDAAPCEVGWCDLVPGGRDLVGEPYEWGVDPASFHGVLCNPSRPIPPETSAVHHITDGDVVGKIFWAEALGACAMKDQGLYSPGAFAAHNAKFEKQWFTDDVTGGKPWICTYKCALRLWPDAPRHNNQTLRYWRNPEGLDRSVAHVAHRAFPDAYVTAFLLREMLALATVEQLISWSSEPAIMPRVTFGMHRGTPWSEVDTGFLRWVLDRDFDEDVLFTARTELERRKKAFAGSGQ